MTTAVLLTSGMMRKYHVPFCRAVGGVTLSLTLIPSCRLLTGKKSLSQRMHNCQYCGVTLDRDVAAAKVIENRGKVAVGQPVQSKFTCGDRGAGVEQLLLFDLVTGQ